MPRSGLTASPARWKSVSTPPVSATRRLAAWLSRRRDGGSGAPVPGRVVGIDPGRLEPAGGRDVDAEVPSTATLADALSAMLLHDTDRVRVCRDGEVLGVLTVSSLLGSAAAG